MRRVLVGGLLVVLCVVAVGAGLLALQSRDEGDVSNSPTGPGERVADRCPATPTPVSRDRRPLSRAQLETALARGNVVLTYRGAAPDAGLRAIQRDLSGPFDPEIAAVGQAVILAPGAAGEARAWGRRLTAGASQEEALRDFADAWLGRGAPKPCR